MIRPESIYIGTPNGTLTISKIENGKAYDQFGKEIPRRAFRFQLNVLSKNWVRPTEVVEQVQIPETQLVTAV
jgi:hypothetical protein